MLFKFALMAILFPSESPLSQLGNQEGCLLGNVQDLGGPLVTSTRWPMFTHLTRSRRNYQPAVDSGSHLSPWQPCMYRQPGEWSAAALIWAHRLETRLLLDGALLMQISCKTRVRVVLCYVAVCERSKRFSKTCECGVSRLWLEIMSTGAHRVAWKSNHNFVACPCFRVFLMNSV